MLPLSNGAQALTQALEYHRERHNVVASNIANVETPGFRPVDILRDSEVEQGRTLPLARTEKSHLNPASAGPGLEGVHRVEDTTAPVGADGNSVSLEREMSKLAANDLRYQAAARFISKHLGMLRYAATGGNG